MLTLILKKKKNIQINLLLRLIKIKSKKQKLFLQALIVKKINQEIFIGL